MVEGEVFQTFLYPGQIQIDFYLSLILKQQLGYCGSIRRTLTMLDGALPSWIDIDLTIVEPSED